MRDDTKIGCRLRWRTVRGAGYAGSSIAAPLRMVETRWSRATTSPRAVGRSNERTHGGDNRFGGRRSGPAQIYAQSLRLAGHCVWEAEDGGQALELVRSRSPELLLLDIWMPIFNGLEVLERLKTTPQAVGLKVVVLSNHHDADTRLEGSALGVVDYWTKDLRPLTSAKGSKRSCGRSEPRTPGPIRPDNRAAGTVSASMVLREGFVPASTFYRAQVTRNEIHVRESRARPIRHAKQRSRATRLSL